MLQWSHIWKALCNSTQNYKFKIMENVTKEAFLKAYINLQRIVEDLYAASDEAVQNENDADASLLEAQAEKIFERAEAISSLISEQENG
jgi:hypothetical protein